MHEMFKYTFQHFWSLLENKSSDLETTDGLREISLLYGSSKAIFNIQFHNTVGHAYST